MAKIRNYTQYTPELRDKAFALFLEGKKNWEIQKELGIGDSSGVSKIKKQDSWVVRKKLIEQNVILTTQSALLKEEGGMLTPGGDINKAVQDYAARNAEILVKLKKIGDTCLTYLDDGNGSKPKSFSEAVHIWLEAIKLERSLIGSSIEEGFVVQVFEVLKSEINDIDLLKRVGIKLKAILK